MALKGTLQLNARVPFNAMSEIDINYGLELGAELRFYLGRIPKRQPQGFYLAFRMEGGYVNYDRSRTYQHLFDPQVYRVYDFELNRFRTSLAGSVGMQAKLTKRLHFDAQVGLGFSNINAQQNNVEIDDNFTPAFWMDDSYNPVYYSYDEGKYVSGFFPVALSLGYNFGS